jgi:N-acyl-D-amino-acid deacylase
VSRLPDATREAKPFFPLASVARFAETSAMHRRRFLATTSAAVATAPFVTRAAEAPSLASFDQAMETFIEARKMPGGALAVVKDGRLVHARGYGWADKERQQRVEATSLYRIASISKPVTAVAVLKLVEQGKLKLDDRAFDFIALKPLPGAKPDPRLRTITIRQCLQHTGGWDRDKSYDPMFRPKLIAEAAKEAAPASASAVIRYMLGQPLDFDPGTRYAYSNFGYCVLGRVIEKVTGKTYEAFVNEAVLAPSGIKTMRLGRSLESGRAPGEVRYYMPEGEQSESVFPGLPPRVPWPYGAFNLEAMDAHGAWLASAVDLARFAGAMQDAEKCPLLKPATWRELHAPPPATVARAEEGPSKGTYYCCGWLTRPIVGQPGKANYWHSGSLPGTYTMLVRRWDGLSWAALFNQRSKDRKLDSELDPALHRAADAVKDWPKEDLFKHFA